MNVTDGSTFLKTVFSHGSTTGSSANLQANFFKAYNTFFFCFYIIQSGKCVVTPHTLKKHMGACYPLTSINFNTSNRTHTKHSWDSQSFCFMIKEKSWLP